MQADSALTNTAVSSIAKLTAKRVDSCFVGMQNNALHCIQADCFGLKGTSIAVLGRHHVYLCSLEPS